MPRERWIQTVAEGTTARIIAAAAEVGMARTRWVEQILLSFLEGRYYVHNILDLGPQHVPGVHGKPGLSTWSNVATDEDFNGVAVPPRIAESA